MSDKKIIAVMGATGAQGGGLVGAIMGDPGGGFTARGITPDVNSETARALAKLGAEVVAADIARPWPLESDDVIRSDILLFQDIRRPTLS